MKITAPRFRDNGPMPEIFSFEDGDCINPELRVTGVPEGTKSFVLVMNDIDAPGGSFIHWIVFNIPADRTVIEQDSIPGIQGVNDAKRKNYTGPRPPSGAHRYTFTLFALDTFLDLKEGASKKDILEAMRDRVLDFARITGAYSKKEAAARV